MTADARLLTTAEVAAMFGRSERWVERHRRELGQRKIGRTVRYPLSAVLEFGGPPTEQPTPIRREQSKPAAGRHPVFAFIAEQKRTAAPAARGGQR